MLKRIIGRFKEFLEFELRYWKRRRSKDWRPATVLVYPQRLLSRSALYKICKFLGLKITRKLGPADIVIDWTDATYRSSHPELARFGKVINLRATNISKTNVQRIQAEVFGYATAIDPLTYRGPCLRKSDVNALHDGVIVQCPIEKLESGFVYEKLIDNMTSAGALDMRVPIFGSILPLVYHKTRSLEARFLKFHSAKLRETDDVLSRDEQAKILRFCQELGLDYGELDVLRDNGDRRIYVVDANNTPDSIEYLTKEEREEALNRTARAFVEAFLHDPSKAPRDHSPARHDDAETALAASARDRLR